MTELEQYRSDIEKITADMMKLLEARLDASKQVALYKKAHDMAIFQPEREQALIEKMTSDGPYQEEKKAFLETLMTLSKKVQKKMTDES